MIRLLPAMHLEGARHDDDIKSIQPAIAATPSPGYAIALNNDAIAHIWRTFKHSQKTAIAHLENPSFEGFLLMNDTHSNVRQHVYEHSPAHYTAQQIAEAHNVSEVTVRTRWFTWLCKVAPAQLLKSDRGYSDLAYALFAEFSDVDKRERPAWVADAKSRYSSEWGNVGIIDCEVMPENVGHALALLQTNNDALQQSLLAELQNVEAFVDHLGQVEANFSEAELQNFQTTGAKRGIVRFKIEAQAEAETLNALRQRRLSG